MERERAGQTTGPDGRIAFTGLLLVQIVLGYEWLASGITKLVHGDFPAGLREELSVKAQELSGWYPSFLADAVIPHARAFGYLIEVGELLTGLALIGAAVAWLAAGDRLGSRGWTAVLLAIAGAAAVGLVMNVNFHLANGSALPTPVAAESFDEAIDLDSLMAALELVLIAVTLNTLFRSRSLAALTRTGVDPRAHLPADPQELARPSRAHRRRSRRASDRRQR